jgi:hypothetical protein
MIFQGLFNILDLYLNEIDLFYNNIDKYFREKISNFIEEKSFKYEDLNKELKEILLFLTNEFYELGFEREEIEKKFSDQFVFIMKNEIDSLTTPIKRYEKKIAPIIFEIFLEKIVDYIIDDTCVPLMLKLKSKEILSIEFVIELRNLKNLYEKSPEKKENLRKYIGIQDRIIQKFQENKNNIESLEDLKNPQDKLQLLYLIYRIIDYFYLQKAFDFSHIKEFIQNNSDEWLISIPLITLKNPDIYFCGIYLAKHLNIEIDELKIKKFLLNLYEENIDEFEAPIIEATDRVYYYFKSTDLLKLYLRDEEINEIMKVDSNYFFETHYLKNLETSQLVVILKLYKYLRLYQKLEPQKIRAISDEIDRRISSEGIKHYRDGFVTSEATYYVLFFNYMKNTLEKLKDLDLLDMIVSRIYRNLEILNFSGDTNYDLISEIFYSIESLKLFNCIETKLMIISLAKYMFPKEVIDKISNSEEIKTDQTTAKFRHFKVNRITGETIY